MSAAREDASDGVTLMVNANGPCTREQAPYWFERFSEYGVTRLKEPVAYEDIEGRRLLHNWGPAGMAITVDEYRWNLTYANEMIELSLRTFCL